MAEFDSVYKPREAQADSMITVVEYVDPEKRKIPAITKTFLRHGSSNFLEVNLHIRASQASEGVVKFYSHMNDRGLLRIIMQHCEQGSLVQVMKDRGGMHWTLDELLALYHSMLRTINDLHNIRITHRCIDCSNWLMTSEGEVKLCDFGQAKQVKSKETTYAHTIRANPQYASAFLNNVDESTEYNPFLEDIWSLGKVFFEMSVLKIYTNLHTFPIEKLTTTVRNGLQRLNSPDLSSLILGMLNPNPRERFNILQCLEIMEALQRPISVPPISPLASPIPESSFIELKPECMSCSSPNVLSGLFGCEHLSCLECVKKWVLVHVSIACATCKEKARVNQVMSNPQLTSETKDALLAAMQKACDDKKRRLRR